MFATFRRWRHSAAARRWPLRLGRRLMAALLLVGAQGGGATGYSHSRAATDAKVPPMATVGTLAFPSFAPDEMGSPSVVLAGNAFSPPLIFWQRRYDNHGQADLAWDLVESPDGGYLMVGATGPIRCGLGCDADGWVVRTDELGRLLWTRQLGGDGFDLLLAAATAADGFLVAGSKVVASEGRQAWLAKLDPGGEVLWERTYGGAADDNASDLLVDGERIWLVGDTRSHSQSDRRADVWLLQVDLHGAVISAQTYDFGAEDIATSIVRHGEDRYALAAVSCTAACGTPVQRGHTVVTVLDPSGRVTKSMTFAEGSKTKIGKLLATWDGGLLMIGSSSLRDIFPSEDVLLIKLNKNFEIQWRTFIGDRGRYDGGFDALEREPGYYVVTTYSQSYQTPELNFDNFSLFGVNDAGATLWTMHLGGPHNDQARAILPTADGGFVVAGFRDAVSWPLNEIPGPADFWLVRFGRWHEGRLVLPYLANTAPGATTALSP